MPESIKFLKTRPVKSPSRANKYDAGIDFYVPEFTLRFLEDLKQKNPNSNIQNGYGVFTETCIKILEASIIIPPLKRILIPSGIHCQMSSPGRALIAANKSGVTTKTGLIAGACVVDFEYMGEIHISLINTSSEKVVLTPGMKVIQFLETPIFNSDIEVEENKTPDEFYEKETTRGAGGFGSSDKK